MINKTKKFKKPRVKNVLNKFVSIKVKLVLSYILFASIPLLVVNIISSSISKDALHINSQQLTQEMVKQTSLNVDFFVNGIQNNIAKFAMVDLMKDVLAVQYSSEQKVDKLTTIKAIEEKINYLKITDKDINHIILIFKDGTIVGNTLNIDKEDLMLYRDLEIGDDIVWKKGLGKATEKMFALKGIKDLSGKSMCTVIVEIRLDPIKSNIRDMKLLDHSAVYITDSDGNIICSKDESQYIVDNYIWETISSETSFGSTIAHNKLITYSILSNGWRLITEIPETSLTAGLDRASLWVWSIILMTSLMAVGVGLIVARSFSSPIIKLMDLMRCAEQGDLTVKIKERGNDEIAKLCIDKPF